MYKLKTTSIILILALVFSIAGCNSGNPGNPGNSGSQTKSASSVPSPVQTGSMVSQSTTGSSATSIKPADTYELKCSYLKNPDSIIEVADKSAKFWEKAYDPEYGGFYTYIGRDGSVDKTKSSKVSIIQFRNAFAFTKAYQLTGKKEYLDYAQKGLDFVYKHAWDDVNGGWYQEMNRDGSIATSPIEGMNWNDYKWSGSQFSALQGITAVVGATRSKSNEEWLTKSFASINKNMWDARPGYEGYYEMAGKNWSDRSNKSPFSSLDAITSHAYDMYLLDLNSDYKKRVITVADAYKLHIAKTMDNRPFGFVDVYDSDWNPLAPQSVTSSGNYLKSAWCLNMAYLINPKEEYKTEAEKLVKLILDGSAYDKEHGGPFASLDPQTGNPTDRKKSWWILEDGVTSGLIEYYITGKPEYLKMADESMSFFMNYMNDPQYGDAYNGSDADGSNPDMHKGDYWKDAFHTQELYFYTYLYGNLMVQNKPVTLFYNIEPDKTDRNITLNPISLGQNKLIISELKLNGKDYSLYDSTQCLVKLPANTGGELKVTFKRMDQ